MANYLDDNGLIELCNFAKEYINKNTINYAMTDITPYFATSSSPESYPALTNTDAWSTTMPEAEDGQYIWVSFLDDYSDESTKFVNPILLTDTYLYDTAAALQTELETTNGELAYLEEKIDNLYAGLHADKIAFAVYAQEDNSLTFYSDYVIPSTGIRYKGKMITSVYSGFTTMTFESAASAPWYSRRSSVESVVFAESFKDIAPISLDYWFYGFSNATFTGMENLDTSQVTSMYSTFYNCSSLTDISALNNWSVTKVATVHQMFRGCSSIENVNLSWNAPSLKTFSQWFYGCSGLNSINLTGIDTNVATTFANLFNGCSTVKTIDLRGWDTTKVTSFNSMFSNCTSLETIYCNKDFNLSGNPTSTNMFYNCTNLVGGNGTKYSEENLGCDMARIDTEENPGYFTYKGVGD